MLQFFAKPLEEVPVRSVWLKVGNPLLHGDIVSADTKQVGQLSSSARVVAKQDLTLDCTGTKSLPVGRSLVQNLSQLRGHD